MRVFISHAPEDTAIAKQRYHDLNQLPDIELWMADMDLLPGLNRKREIQKAIRESRYVIAVLSRRSMEQAGSVHREMRLALDELDEMPEGEIFIIPVRVDECSPAHDRLRDIRSADLFPSYEEGVALIGKALGVSTEGFQKASADSGVMREASVPPSGQTVNEQQYGENATMNDRTEQVQRLTDALLDCDAMMDRDKRKTIVQQLPASIQRRVNLGNSPVQDVMEIVRCCADYAGGIDELMKAVGYMEGESIPFVKAMQVRRTVFDSIESNATGDADTSSDRSGSNLSVSGDANRSIFIIGNGNSVSTKD